MCRECIAEPPPFTLLLSLCAFNPLAKKVIHSFKYGGSVKTGRCIAAQMALFLAAKMPELIERKPAIVPVPLSWKKELKRGFNQTAILCHTLTKLTGLPTFTTFLRRRVTFTPSARAKEFERRILVKDTFRADPLRIPPQQHIILLDDVATTLSTLRECTREILRATGHEKIVWAFTIARSE